MKVKQPSSVMCPRCGHRFVSRQPRMSDLKRLGAARVRALDEVQVLAELKAVRASLDDMRAKVLRLRKYDLTLHRMANVGRLGREELHESLGGARARIQKLQGEERALLKRLQRLK